MATPPSTSDAAPQPAKAMACIETLREMVRDEQDRLLIWPTGESHPVAPKTAFFIIAAYTLMSEAAKADLARRVESGRLPFVTAAAFCESVLR